MISQLPSFHQVVEYLVGEVPGKTPKYSRRDRGFMGSVTNIEVYSCAEYVKKEKDILQARCLEVEGIYNGMVWY